LTIHCRSQRKQNRKSLT